MFGLSSTLNSTMYTSSSSKQEGYTSIATHEPREIDPLEPCALVYDHDELEEGGNRGFDQFMLAILLFMLGSCVVYAVTDSIIYRNDQILEHDFMLDKVACSLNVSTMQIKGNWNITMRVNNRSYMAKVTKDFLYENSIIIILYKNSIISATTLPGFYQRINNTKIIDATFASTPTLISNEYVSATMLRRWKSKLPMFVNVKIIGWVKYFPREGWSQKYRMSISCWDVKLEFHPTTKDTAILSGRGSEKCEVNIY